MITVYCTCGHLINDHEHDTNGVSPPFHTGPCHREACSCRRFKLDRSRTRYETATQRTRARDAQIHDN